jgi:hypothetical protein
MLSTIFFSSVFGKVNPPPGVSNYNAQAGGIGIILFASNLIKIATIVAGVWVLFNIITAGYLYITESSNSGTANKVKDQITSSVLGLIIIVLAHSLIALISFFLFKDATFILNPKITGP